MLLLERHGKSLLRQHGVKAPEGCAVSTSSELDAALANLQYPIALKAQIPTGARGKNGGIHFANDREQAQISLETLLGKSISGHVVHEVLVEPRIQIAAERYLAALVHDDEIHIMACPRGGIDIEQTAATHPAQIMLLRANTGIVDQVGLASGLRSVGFPAALIDHYVDTCLRLCELMKAHDATLAEINPLVETFDDELLALDARIDIDDAALPRQPDIVQYLNRPAPERQATYGLPHPRPVTPEGNVGLIGLGGGLNLSIIDWLSKAGRPVAAVTDIDEAISQDRVREFIRVCVMEMRAQHNVSVVFINAISCGYVLGDVAAALVDGLNSLPACEKLPVIFNLQGRDAENASRILRDGGWENAVNLAAAMDQVIRVLKD